MIALARTIGVASAALGADGELADLTDSDVEFYMLWLWLDYILKR